MTAIEGIKINESETYLENGKKGKVAVFIYVGDCDPKPILKYAVKQYVGDYQNYIELVDSQLDCPWVRVVISDVNDMKQYDFDDYYKNIILKSQRNKKLKNINLI